MRECIIKYWVHSNITLFIFKYRISLIEGVAKNLTFHFFSSLYLSSGASDLLNSCVDPPNTPLIMGGKHTSFKDQLLTRLNITKRIYGMSFFFATPFINEILYLKPNNVIFEWTSTLIMYSLLGTLGTLIILVISI